VLRRRRFSELVTRQLDLFEADSAPLLADAADADAAWTRADREESESRFGDYVLEMDEVGERLYAIRETYASTLDPAAAEEYRAAFNRGAKKRFRGLADFLEHT
jgi:hypothetical protein